MAAIIIIGASNSPQKFSYKAVIAYRDAGYEVYPVNPHENMVAGIPCSHSIEEVPVSVELASLYVRPSIGQTLVHSLKEKGVKKVYVNPGAESKELLKDLHDAGIEPLQICSIVALHEFSRN